MLFCANPYEKVGCEGCGGRGSSAWVSGPSDSGGPADGKPLVRYEDGAKGCASMCAACEGGKDMLGVLEELMLVASPLFNTGRLPVVRELLRPVPPPVGGARAEDDGRVAADTAPGPAEGMSATDTLSAIPLLPPPLDAEVAWEAVCAREVVLPEELPPRGWLSCVGCPWLP